FPSPRCGYAGSKLTGAVLPAIGLKSMPPFNSQPASMNEKFGMLLFCAPALAAIPTDAHTTSAALHSKENLDIREAPSLCVSEIRFVRLRNRQRAFGAEQRIGIFRAARFEQRSGIVHRRQRVERLMHVCDAGLDAAVALHRVPRRGERDRVFDVQ